MILNRFEEGRPFSCGCVRPSAEQVDGDNVLYRGYPTNAASDPWVRALERDDRERAERLRMARADAKDRQD